MLFHMKREGILPQLLSRAAVTHAVVSMTSSHTMQYIGLLLLAAILLQTIAVAVTFIYFSNVLSTVRAVYLMRFPARYLRTCAKFVWTPSCACCDIEMQ